MNRIARFLLVAGTVACISLPCFAQNASAPPTPFERQMAHIDFGLTAIGQFGKTVSGVVPQNSAPDAGATVSEHPSTTVGALANIRYTPKPYLGLEINYSYARYTESFYGSSASPAGQPFTIQTQVNETTFGYIVTPPHPIFGLQPYASAGFGSTRFRPTAGGGESSPIQWRATYYYTLGVQKEFADSHFGARLGFRQTFFLAPDFLENYLTILKHTDTAEPSIGFYLRF